MIYETRMNVTKTSDYENTALVQNMDIVSVVFGRFLYFEK